jgi:hypothetical protein
MLDITLHGTPQHRNSLSMDINVRGWVIKANHDYRGSHECAFKVNNVGITFEVESSKLGFMPDRLSIQGNWSTKDGRKWMDNGGWLPWDTMNKLKFEFLPDAIQQMAYQNLVKYLEQSTITLGKNLQTLKINKRFVPLGYVDMNSNDDSEDALPFLPSVRTTQPSPFIGMDVSKWKVAREEMAWDPSKATSNAETSSEV